MPAAFPSGLLKLNDTIYDFETLTTSVSPFQQQIKPENISLLLMKKVKSTRKKYELKSIDIPLFGTDDEIKHAYCHYHGFNPNVVGMKQNVGKMRNKLLNMSIKYYENQFGQ